MRYAIAINLDYESHAYKEVRAVYETIREAMLARGFREDGRVFTIELPKRDACDLARQVVEDLEREQLHPKSIYGYIKEFYGFEFEHAENLLLPPSGEIDVEELSELDAGVDIVQLGR